MKKFLLSLVGLFVAFAANAVDYYLIGGFNGWKEADPSAKFTAGSNGEYTLDYQGTLTSGFKINDGTWKNDDANFGGSAKLTIGVVYNLVAAGNSGNITMDGNIDNPHIVFNPTKKTILITGQQVDAEYKYGIHGSIFDATDGWKTEDMTEEDGKWVLKAEGTFDGSFGIKVMDKGTGAQTGWLSNVDNVTLTLGTPVSVGDTDKNFSLDAGDYTFTFDPNAMTLLVEGSENGGGGGDDPIENNYLELYLRGEMTGDGWAAIPDYKMTTTDGITYTLTVPEMTTGEFKFATANWSKSYTYGFKELGNGEFKFTDIFNVNTSLAVGGNVTFTLVLSEDKESAMVTIAGQNIPTDDFTPIYLVSSRNSFQVTSKFKMATTDGQTYTLHVPDAGSDIAFKFMVRKDPADPTKDVYFSDGHQNIHNGTFTLTENVDRNMTLHTGGDVTFTVKPLDDYSALEVTVEGQDHNADPYPPIYLVGSMTEWEAEEKYRLDTEDGHTYTLTVPDMSNEVEFQFLGTDAHNYWFSNGDKEMVAGDYELTTGNVEGYNMKLLNGGNVTFTFVLSDLHESATLKVAFEGGDDPIPPIGDEYPEHLYVIGMINDNGWNPSTAVEMTTGENGVYTLTNATIKGGNCNFSFTTQLGENADDWNVGDRYQDAGGDGGEMEPNTEGVITGTLVKNPAVDAAFQVAAGVYDMTVDLATLTLTMKKVGEVPVDPIDPDDPTEYPEHLYVVGQVNDNAWTPSSAVELAAGENGVYTLTNATIKGGDCNFSFITNKPEASLNEWNEVGDRYQDANGDGGVMEPNAEGVITGSLAKNPSKDAAFQVAAGVYDMTVDLATLTLTMKKVGEVEIEEPTETEYYLVGGFNSWANPGNYKFEKGDQEGEYVITLEQFSDDFKITDGTWAVSYGSSGSTIELGVPYECNDDTQDNLSLGEGVVIENVKMVFVPATKTLTVTGTLADVEPDYVYHIHGTTSNETDATWVDVDMEEQADGTWTLSVENGFVKFDIVRVNKALNNAESWIKSDIAPAEGEVVISANGDFKAAVGGPSDFTSSLNGECLYIFDPETMTLTVDGTTGISAIEAEEGEAIYFNLQGQRVANPDKGIYIRVVNGKAAKVVK